MVGKNDIVIVKIEDISSEGQGIGVLDDKSTGGACGFVMFVKDTVIGDIVEAKVMKVKKTYGYAKLIRIIEPSKDRVAARCPVARQCGGCQLQEMSYPAQLRFKQNKAANNLKRIGGLSEDNGDYDMLPIIGMEPPYEPFRYRNKAQYPVGQDADGNIRIGFYAGRTHSIIECGDCCIGSPVNEGIIAIVREWMLKNNIKAYDELSHKGCVRHILIRIGYATGQIGVCLVVNGGEPDNISELAKKLSEVEGMASITLNYNCGRTNVILGDRCQVVWGSQYIEDYIGGVRYRISPLSFYQVNPVQTKRMYEKVLEFAQLTGSETVWDLYCGIGTISLFLAGHARVVYGVESVLQAVEDARCNAVLNGLENVWFFEGRAEEVVPHFYEGKGFSAGSGGLTDNNANSGGYNELMLAPDVMVVDPPRRGCDPALLDTMLAMKPSRIVYVSCDSATLARDLKYLCAGGAYKVEKVQCYDNFCQGVHVESVGLISRKDN